MTSSSVPRPAPSATAARPIGSACERRHEPVARRATRARDPARTAGAVVVDDARIAALVLDDLRGTSRRPAPDAMRRAHARLGVRFVVGSTPADDQHARREQHRQLSRDRSGPRPFSVSIDSITSLRVADRAAERRVHAR